MKLCRIWLMYCKICMVNKHNLYNFIKTNCKLELKMGMITVEDKCVACIVHASRMALNNSMCCAQTK